MTNEVNLKDYIITKTKLPIYLEGLLEEKDSITLVFQRGKSRALSSSSTSDLLDTLNSTSNTTLNLTGCPLVVDLNVTPTSILCDPLPCKVEDGNNLPMNIQNAIKFNNHYNKKLRKELGQPYGVYCICNASDKRNTIVLGSHVSADSVVSRMLVCACDPVKEFWSPSIMCEMLDSHYTNTDGVQSKNEIKVKSFHEVYGYKLNPSHNLNISYNSGYIAIEAEWYTNEFNIPEHNTDLKMLLQIVTGHENSLLYSIHQEIILLQKCINMLQDGDLNDDTIICNSVDFEDDLKCRLGDALHEVSTMRATGVPQDVQQALAHIEKSKLTDKLWKILSCSPKLSSLRDALNSLCNMCGSESVRVQILDDDLTTTLSYIIKSICKGELIVPVLSSKQALILLIELGLQTIKKTLTFVVKAYDLKTSNCLNQQWSKLDPDCTVQLKMNILENANSDAFLKKANYLYSVYIVLEFIQLVEQNCIFSKPVGISVLKGAFNKFVPPKNNLCVNGNKQLFDLDLPVTYNDITLATEGPPSTWSIRMTSVKEFPWPSSVTTLFHYSRIPIFPENIYKYKDAECVSDDIQKYFVTRTEIYSDKLPV